MCFWWQSVDFVAPASYGASFDDSLLLVPVRSMPAPTTPHLCVRAPSAQDSPSDCDLSAALKETRSRLKRMVSIPKLFIYSPDLKFTKFSRV